MILLRDIRDYIASLGIAEDENCYCGKMADKKPKAVGIYPQKQRQTYHTALGGTENQSYEVKAISLLVHWTKSITETEKAAQTLQEALILCKEQQINGHTIQFIFAVYDEPIPVDTDDNGIFEFVIECLFYFRKE